MSIEEAETVLDKQDYKDIILMFLILFFIIVLVYGIVIYKADAFICLEDPVRYYEHLSNLTCSCQKSQAWTGFNYSVG